MRLAGFLCAVWLALPAAAQAHVTVHPDANRKRGLDLFQLAMDLNAQGVGLPLLLR